MEISSKDHGKAVVITLAGGCYHANAPTLAAELKRLFALKKFNVILDVSGVNFFSSACLHQITIALATNREKGGDVRLVNPSRAVTTTIETGGLEDKFITFPSVGEAIASFV